MQEAKMIVWIPFGDLMHEREPGPNYAKTQANPDWWKFRAKILAAFTLPALKRQTHQSFYVIAGISKECGDLATPVIEVLRGTSSGYGHSIFRHSLTDPKFRGQTASPDAIAHCLENFGAVQVVWMDSDDMYAPDALDLFASKS